MSSVRPLAPKTSRPGEVVRPEEQNHSLLHHLELEGSPRGRPEEQNQPIQCKRLTEPWLSNLMSAERTIGTKCQ